MASQGKRSQNETKFDSWIELPSGGRQYRLEVKGRRGWRAVYFKLVDESEITLRFWQEVVNPEGEVVEIHEKYPRDLGHKQLPKKDQEHDHQA
jgi:hypothetical protein